MIPLYKLEKLPRTQKLRKIIKIFSFAENRLCMSQQSNIFSDLEYIFFHDAVKMLSKDDQFTLEAKKVFNETAEVFNSYLTRDWTKRFTQRLKDTKDTENSALLLRRALNSVKHILLNETGKDQADWDFTCADGKLDSGKRQIFLGMQVYLEDIRSPFNVGAMFRTAESFGVEKILLSPFCADPRHRRAERTAMGCIDIVPWEKREFPAAQISDNENAHNILNKPSISVFALETGGVPISEFKFPKQGLMIVGSEELGVSPQMLEAADASLGRVSIPCYGTKASLNVSTAFGIALQAWSEKLNRFSLETGCETFN